MSEKEKLSKNQQLFIRDAEEQDYEVNHGYSGRGMYGRTCPSISVSDITEFTSHSKYCYDQLGKGYVLYARS